MQKLFKYKLYTTSLIPFIFILAILLARYYGGHVLFHTIAEFFSILVGLMMIVIVSYTYQFTKNNFLLYLGIGYFWIAILDFMHMLSYPGMSIFTIAPPNITLTFWIAARLLEAFVLLSAIFANFHTISKSRVFILFALITASIYSLAFSKYVPILYEPESGLTSLKINLEYTIIFILMLTIVIYTKKKKNFDESIYYYIIASIVLTIITELILTFYTKVDDSFTMFAHLFKFLSYWMIFLSMIKTSLEKPFKFLAHESSTYNSIPFPSVLVDAQGLIRQINASTTSFLNLEEEKIINQNNHILFHNQNTKENECEVCQAIKNGKTLLSYPLEKETSTYSFTVNPIHMEETALGSVQVCIDISEQLKNEFSLIAKESRFRMLFENSEISIWNEDITEVVKSLEELRKSGITDLHKHLTKNIKLAQEIAMKVKVVDVNSATLKLFNADSKDQFLTGINKTFGDNAIEVFIDELDAIWHKKESFSKEALFKTLDDRVIHGIVTFQIPKELEQFSNLSVSIIDITNLKKAEKELQITNDKLVQKKNEFETIIKEAPNPMIIFNEDDKITMINKAWSDYSGYKIEDIPTVDTLIDFMFDGDMRTTFKEHINRLYDLTEPNKASEFTILTKNRDKVIWQFSSAPLGVIDGKRTVISSAVDVTELKDKDKMLINQSRHAAMGEMIGMIAHQWRQPISVISMDANNMLLDIALENFNTAQAEKYANSITEQTQHLSQTIDDFRNFFKPDKVISEVNIREILDSTLSIVKDSLRNNNIELKISCQTEKEVDAYPRELMQVFVNIITNSKDALVVKNRDNSIININVYEDEKYVNTEICDNGGGIEANILPKVFDPYFSTKDEKTGTGLGLYMSKMIIEKHLNGGIEVYNSNEGACFTIRLLKN